MPIIDVYKGMMRIFNFKSLSTKLFLVILIATLPLLVWSIYAAHHERESEIEEAKNEALHLTVVAAESQKQMVAQMVSLLDAAAAVDQILDDPKICNAVLDNMLIGKTEYVNLFIVRTNGEVSCSAQEPAVWAPDAAMIDRVMAAGRMFTVTNQANESGEMVLLTRVLDLHAIPVGVGAAIMKPHWFNEQVTELHETPPGTEIMVVDAVGNVLYHSIQTEQSSQQNLSGTLLAALQPGQTSVQAFGLDGVERFYGIKSLPFAPDGIRAYVLVGLPTDSVIKEANRQLQFTLLVIGLILLVSFLASIASEKWLVIRWLQPLIVTAQRLQTGDLSARTSIINKGSELGFLAQTIDSMAETLECKTAELREVGARYYNLFSGVPVGLYRTTPEGKLLDGNPALQNMFGISESELGEMLNVAAFFVDPEARQRWTDAMARLGVVNDFEFLLRRRNGEIITVLDNARAVFDEAGAVEYYEGSLLDITQQKQSEQALLESNERLNSVLNSITEAYLAFDNQYRILELNPAATRHYFGGRPANDLIGKVLWAEYPQTVNGEFFSQFRSAMDEKRPKHFDARSSINGRWWETHAYPTHDRLEVFLRDITERKQAETALIHARDYYLSLFNEFPALIWRAGVDAKSDYFNKTWLKFTGRTMEQEKGYGWTEGVHKEDLDRCVTTYLEAFKARQPFQMEYRLRRFDGEYRWLQDLGYPYYGLSGDFEGYIGSCYDITEQKQSEAHIRDLAYRDPLTGLFNRKAFRERLEQELDRAKRCDGKFAVLFMDLNNFKEINDRFGHDAGDQALVMIAQTLQNELRADDMVARLGGDEFTILLPDLKNLDDPKRVAKRVLIDVKKPLIIEGNTVELSTSIGVSLYPEDGTSARELLNKADQRMFHNKHKEKKGNRTTSMRNNEKQA